MPSQSSWAIAGTILLTGWVASPIQAQIPLPQNLELPALSLPSSDAQSRIMSGCIRLDGRCLFQVAAPQSELPARIQDIQQRLETISRQYLQEDSSELQIESKKQNNLPVIYVNDQPLLTVTRPDADLQGGDLDTRAEKLKESLQEGLKRAKRERQPQFLTRRGAIAGGFLVAMIVSSCAIHSTSKRSRQRLTGTTTTPTGHPVTTQLAQQQQGNLQEVQRRLYQMAQASIWGGGTLIGLGLFPYTRILQVLMLNVLQIPLRLGIVGLGTYVVIRLSYVLIDRFAGALANSYLLTPEASRRLQLRVSTISGVTKSITTLVLLGVGSLVALTTLGVEIAPLLAGAGLVGVAVSLASQNLIKDAINGFLIIVEDQYAVGDVIAVGDVGGLVENINLRITQVRDAEGRLITIPNSEIKIVANLSSNWSRADLNIPVAYHADVDQALKLIDTIAQEMSRDVTWQEQILEKPQVLGVDNFGERGVTIRVWIKTQPLKQWDVAREFRRRLKIAFDEAGVPIPLPQQEIWFNRSLPAKSQMDEHESHSPI
ncbi:MULTISPECIES: mechanosensitive ion channel family protein [unclassified Coleofasciculus]|uniref:mechanosensitive ion channel family protein n=1 Tax=Cyanophyceae TaxID=3028117 RepID=UPI00168A08EA|nr:MULTISPECIES: mechanosensitive ion channel family protein [unclassified Coleofasciculus]MBD1894700.1 mechanosensitive ion channel family protein [Coleofasciculus sp. FACHB-129]MBD2087049.1 mechanosensitive ion channel family protein [Coleofasciculus sp. FACHB-542]